MNRAKFFTIVLGLSAPLLLLLLPFNPALKHYTRRHAPAKNSTSRSRAIPPAAMPPISAALGRDDARYRVVGTGRGLRTANPGHDLTATFTARSVALASGGSQLRVALSAYGRPGAMHVASPAIPESRGNRVDYRRGMLTEWYVNGPLGLEQGFTLNAPPDAKAGELEIAVSLWGDMTPTAQADAQSVAFASRDGKTRILYAGLVARDSTGRELPAHMDLRGDRLILVVNDFRARYPVIIDPTYQQTGIITANTPAGSFLGAGAFGPGGVAIDSVNETIVAAAQGQGNGQLPGSAYVFLHQNGGWVQATQLLNVDLTIASVAISGDGNTIVVGSCGLNNCTGHAFVYVKPSNGWSDFPTQTPTATLSSPNAAQGDRVGFSVATDQLGDTVAFSAPCDFTAGLTLCGSVDVYVIPSTGIWVDSAQPTAILTFSLSGQQVNGLGVSVAMNGNGDTIVAGAPGIEGAGANEGPGFAYVYVRPGAATNSWATTSNSNAILSEGIGFSGDSFGFSASIDSNGDTIAVGAPFARINCGANCSPAGPGAAYVFKRPTTSGGWSDDPNPVTEDAMLAASDGNPSDEFGNSVSVDGAGDTVVVGAPRNPVVNSLGGPGAAYVFDMPSGGWTGFPLNENQKLTAVFGGDFNGNPVAPGPIGLADSLVLSSDGSLVALGNSEATVGANNNQGAVFLFGPGICAVLSPSSANFGSVPQFTTSQSLQFTLSNVCSSSLINVNTSQPFSGPNAGDFSQTNNCSTTLGANSFCTLNVAFTPSIASAESATLSVFDLDSSSPQTAALTGTGIAGNADFSLVATSATPASANSNCNPQTETPGSCSATVTGGSQSTGGNHATYTLQLTSINGFNVPVNFSVSGLDQTFCSGLQSSATPTTTGVSLTMNITPSCSPTGQLRRVAAGPAVFGAPGILREREPALALLPGEDSGTGVLLGSSLPAMVVMGLLFGRKLRRRRLWLQLLALVIIAVTFGGWNGACNPSPPSPSLPPLTAAGTYTVIVTATAPGPSLSHSATVTLVVQCPGAQPLC